MMKLTLNRRLSAFKRLLFVSRYRPFKEVKQYRRNVCTSCTIKAKNKLFEKSTGIPGIPNVYNAVEMEPIIGERWGSRQDRSGDEFPVFRMVLPPPNITGKLHLGHALTVAIQDAIARLKWMTGSNLEWIPGFDHAGIATHSVVLRKLQLASKLSKFKRSGSVQYDLQKELQDFAEANRTNITNQLKQLGGLLDWDKEYYTLDENYSGAVREAFIHLFENGTICRGDGIVNWSCQLETTISDVEVERADFNGKTTFRVPGYDQPIEFGMLYHCSYLIENLDESIIVATSRPETMFGDVAVAVHPDHPKYSRFIGHNVVNPVNGNILPVIGDARVKIDFGTGALKITPAHDKLDFAIGKSNNLPALSIFSKDGRLNDKCGDFSGQGRFTARIGVINYLKNNSALLNTQEYNGSLGICSRSSDIIESILLPHWFFKTDALTKRIMEAIENKNVIIKPDNQKTILLDTLSKAHDWCLSRQIDWGHKIPAFFHRDFPEQWVAAASVESAMGKLQQKLSLKAICLDDVLQDKDVLDTWFSSSLVPLVMSDWPNSDEFKELSVMETGQDILIFWVWRMMLMTLALVGKYPFKNILLHGIVCDYFGRKMSKSRGNVIDPMHIIHGKSCKELLNEAKSALNHGELTENEYKLKISGINKDYPKGFVSCGSDSLRFALLAQDISDVNIKLDVTYLENCRHFCNKLWQAMRFYLLHKEYDINHPLEIASPVDCLASLSFCDKWMLSCLEVFAREYNEAITRCKFHSVTEAIRRFFYLNYCDVYLELLKKDFQDQTSTELHMLVMRYVFCAGLKFAHPFLPFVTEEIWFQMTDKGKMGLLLDQPLPSLNELCQFQDQKSQVSMRCVLRVVRELRHMKKKFFHGSKEIPLFYVEMHRECIDLRVFSPEIETLSKLKVKVEAFGEAYRLGIVSSVFQFDDGSSCRVSFVKKELQDSQFNSS